MKLIWIFIAPLLILVRGDMISTNKMFEAQLKKMTYVLREMHVKYITIGNVTIGEDIKAYGLKLGDLTRLVSKGDSSISIEDDTMTFKGSVAIDKLYLLMDSLKLQGKSFQKVLVVVLTDRLSFSQNTYSTKTECNQTYSDLRLSGVTGVTLYNRPSIKKDITTLFLKEVVPYVNKFLSSQKFMRILAQYLDVCNEKASQNFMEFLESSANIDEFSTLQQEIDSLFITTPSSEIPAVYLTN